MIKTPQQLIQERVNPAQAETQQTQGPGLLKGAFNYATQTNPNTGMSRLQNFAAALDPLILQSMRGGEAIRQQGAQRVASGNKNKTIEYLRAGGFEDVASALEAGSIDANAAVSFAFQRKGADKKYERDLALAGAKGGKDNRIALEKRAELAGLIKGTPEYQTFMLEGGVSSGGAPAQFGAIPAGHQLIEGVDDTGNKIYSMQPMSGGPADMEAKKEYYKQQTNYETASNLIDTISNNPNLASVTGKIQGLIEPASAAGMLAFSGEQIDLIKTIENLQNSVFLEAFQSLKGGGQITELEGEKAQAAIVNLSRQRTTDGFLKAMQTYQSILDIGIERARSGVKIPINQRYTKDLKWANPADGSNPSSSATPKWKVVN